MIASGEVDANHEPTQNTLILSVRDSGIAHKSAATRIPRLGNKRHFRGTLHRLTMRPDRWLSYRLSDFGCASNKKDPLARNMGPICARPTCAGRARNKKSARARRTLRLKKLPRLSRHKVQLSGRIQTCSVQRAWRARRPSTQPC